MPLPPGVVRGSPKTTPTRSRHWLMIRHRQSRSPSRRRWAGGDLRINLLVSRAPRPTIQSAISPSPSEVGIKAGYESSTMASTDCAVEGVDHHLVGLLHDVGLGQHDTVVDRHREPQAHGLLKSSLATHRHFVVGVGGLVGGDRLEGHHRLAVGLLADDLVPTVQRPATTERQVEGERAGGDTAEVGDARWRRRAPRT